ncbi:MAG: ABC transporter ATP-binding protein/permease [Candidatus Margulisbacteria bacterium]|nr:ABC transporter ATP-binding protein/permease [Candidatus Margulisiibacteriota bacterium]MBU1022023.1 ABC transporter ATP-binding protein/permease [Candidatus Margulisiibacteriota bacterium]MBU1729618.1 ABC transporter ATP-binding protein/permease [Candidatus Margulisiibacteriota bacterium]
MATPLITKILIDYAYPNQDLYLLTFLVLLGIVIFLFNMYFSDVSSYLDTFIHQTLSIDLRNKFFTKLLRLPLRFHYEKQVGDLMVRVTDDIDVIIDAVAETIPVVIKIILQLVALLVICLMIDINLTILALIGIPFYFIQTRFFAKRFEIVQEKSQKRESEIYTFYQEKMSNVKTIKSFNQEMHETDRLIDKLKRMFRLVRENLFLGLFNSFFDAIMITLWTSFLAWYAGYRVITGHITIGEIMAILVYLGQIHQPFMDFGTVYKSLVSSFVSINRVNEIFEKEPEAYKDTRTFILYDIKGQVKFDNVSFHYPDTDEYILKNISFNANPGKVTALCGTSGAGKSTILDLLLRFVETNEGEIYIDEYEIKKVSLITLRANISIVSQDVVIFSGTIRENLQYGCKEVDEEKMIQATKDAEIYEFIKDTAKGFDTRIGEGGLGISGGQRQRLSIARALYRGVKILILDEATSALDSITEAKIYKNMQKALEDKTVIMITHRPSSLHNAEKIYVVHENKICESGDFDELLQKKGEFYKFYQAQVHETEEETEEKIKMKKLRKKIDKEKVDKEKAKEELKLSDLEKVIMDMYYNKKQTYAAISKELGMEPYDVNLIRKSAKEKLETLRKLELEE